MAYPRAVLEYERRRREHYENELRAARAIQEAHLRLMMRTLQALTGEEATVELRVGPLVDPNPAVGSAEHWRREGEQ